MNSKIKILKNVAVTALIAAIIGFTSCEKYIWDPPRYEPPDTTVAPILYSTELAPLFPQYNCTGCHGGMILPDLRVNNSYQSLTAIPGKYINKDNPPQSDVVKKMEDSGHGEQFSTEHVTLFIYWIYQGALNN